MRMEAAGSSETMVVNYETKRRHIPESRHLPVFATVRISRLMLWSGVNFVCLFENTCIIYILIEN
jgi:hypothetical protein